MASIPAKPTYFLSPNCDFPPDGFIALGSIIVDPKTPQKSLNHQKNQRIPVPADDLQESYKDDWEDVIWSARHNRVTLWASFLQMILGVGADVSAGFTKGREDSYKFSRLETKYFEPDVTYIEQSLKVESVRGYITATKYKKPIYMVTGTKIVRGPEVSGRTIKEYTGMLKAGSDATMLTGIPVAGGPALETGKMKEREVSFGGGSDYVFAYRVVKIDLSKDGGVKKQKGFTNGALFNTEESNKEADLVDGDWAVEELDTTSEELQGNDVVSEVFEDGEDIAVVIVKR